MVNLHVMPFELQKDSQGQFYGVCRRSSKYYWKLKQGTGDDMVRSYLFTELTTVG